MGRPSELARPPSPLPLHHCPTPLPPLCRAYSHLLYTPAIAAAMAHPSVPAGERLLLRAGGWLIMRSLMAKASWAGLVACSTAAAACTAPAGRLCRDLHAALVPARLPRFWHGMPHSSHRPAPLPPSSQGMRITPENGGAALATIHQVFDDVARPLSDGRRYLAGDAFTAADLSFACLAAPAVGQPYNDAAPGLDSPDMPAAMREQVQALRSHPAGRFALRLWAEERGVVLVQADGGQTPAAAAAGAAPVATRL